MKTKGLQISLFLYIGTGTDSALPVVVLVPTEANITNILKRVSVLSFFSCLYVLKYAPLIYSNLRCYQKLQVLKNQFRK
jgi:hypothetical protein